MARVAVVTGGMGGLGESVCIKLAALGYKVVTTHSPGNTKASEWLSAMKQQGYDFKAYPCDVADWESAAACVKKVGAKHPDERQADEAADTPLPQRVGQMT